jgi:acetyltransferase-like isoleucine patch superfamily enzyme
MPEIEEKWYTEITAPEVNNQIKPSGKVFISKCATIDHRAPIILGDNVTICDRVRMLTHDYSPVAVKKEPEKVAGITIGNNVFIGIDSIILPGVKIGDNVVIGAGSVVAKDVPSNCVFAGNPARKVNDIIVKV